MRPTDWCLDPRLAADTLPLARWPLCDVRLMDEARYPWLVLVPRCVGASELVDLPYAERIRVSLEIDAATRALRELFSPDKLNVAALGNIVSQLHVHVIARFKADAAWPAPVWGAHPVAKRPDAQSIALCAQLREALLQQIPEKDPE